MVDASRSATAYVSGQDRALDFCVNTPGFERRDDRPYGDDSGARRITVAPPGAPIASALGTPQGPGRDPQLLSSCSGVTLIAPHAPMPCGMLTTWPSDPDGNTFFFTEA